MRTRESRNFCHTLKDNLAQCESYALRLNNFHTYAMGVIYILYMWVREKGKMKSLWKPYGNSIWIQNVRAVHASAYNYSFLGVCACECTLWLQEPLHFPSTYANKDCGSMCHECVCVSVLVPVRACLHVCIYKGLAHPTILGFATTHTDRCEDWREQEPRLWSMASLSKYFSLSPSNLCLPLALSFNVCLSLGPSVFSLSHCARHRGPLCYSEKEMRLEPNLPWFLPNIIPPLFLGSPIMRLASDNISLTLGNKWSSHRMDLMMYWMSDFKHY